MALSRRAPKLLPTDPAGHSALFALVAGLGASALAFFGIFLVISVYCSLVYLVAGGLPPDVLHARTQHFSERAPDFGYHVLGALTFAASVLCARRAARGFAAGAAIVVAGAWIGEATIALALGAWSSRVMAIFLVVLIPAGALGALAGWAIGEPARVLRRVKETLKSVRAAHEIAPAIAQTRGVCAAVRLRHGELDVSSDHPWVFVRTRRGMWRRIAELVARKLDDLDALARARSVGLKDERERIGRDIHDTLAQDILSVVVHLESVEAAGADAATRKHIERALVSAREALAGARQVIWATTPKSNASVSLFDALASLLAHWSRRTEVKAALACDGEAEALDSDVEETLLRAAQEALHNIHKHAAAHDVVLTLSYTISGVALDVHDDGSGFDPSRAKESRRRGGGFGLASIREELERIGGTLSVETRPGGGTTLAAYVPTARRFDVAS